jgi:hypothetical protein
MVFMDAAEIIGPDSIEAWFPAMAIATLENLTSNPPIGMHVDHVILKIGGAGSLRVSAFVT